MVLHLLDLGFALVDDGMLRKDSVSSDAWGTVDKFFWTITHKLAPNIVDDGFWDAGKYTHRARLCGWYGMERSELSL